MWTEQTEFIKLSDNTNGTLARFGEEAAASLKVLESHYYSILSSGTPHEPNLENWNKESSGSYIRRLCTSILDMLGLVSTVGVVNKFFIWYCVEVLSLFA